MTSTYDREAGKTAGCPECGGTGADNMDGARPLKCLACGGTGDAPDEKPASEAPARGAAENSARLKSFSSADAAASFRPLYLDRNECRAWIISRLHPDGAHCPDCGLKLVNPRGWHAGKRCHCGRCGRWFTATTSTFLEGTHLDFSQVYLLAVLIEVMEKGLTPARIADVIGVSADTVRLWIKRLRAFEGE